MPGEIEAVFAQALGYMRDQEAECRGRATAAQSDQEKDNALQQADCWKREIAAVSDIVRRLIAGVDATPRS